MNATPRVSIITINYNNLAGLEQTFNSVVSQTYSDFEFVVIDGGSTDGSAAFIEANQARLDYWVSEPDKGIYNAMNKGILKSKGEYLLFLNSGDWFHKETILSKVFDVPRSADILYGNINEILPNGENRLAVPLVGDRLTMANFNSNTHATVLHQASFIKKSLFDKGLYDESYKIIADIKFFIESIIIRNCSVEYLPFVISNFNLEGLSNIPENWPKTIKERERIFSEVMPPRILKDYELFFQIKDSELMHYIPLLEKTEGLKRWVNKITISLIKTYKIIKRK